MNDAGIVDSWPDRRKDFIAGDDEYLDARKVKPGQPFGWPGGSARRLRIA
jgi:hypothetical protein